MHKLCKQNRNFTVIYVQKKSCAIFCTALFFLHFDSYQMILCRFLLACQDLNTLDYKDHSQNDQQYR